MLRISRKENGACEKYFRWVRRAHEHMSQMCLITLSSVNKGDSLFLHRPEGVAPECTLDDGEGRHIKVGRHVSLRPPPISLVYDTAELIGVDVCAWAFFYIRFYEWSTLFILSANNNDFS